FLGGGFLVSSISLKNQKAGWGLLVSSLSGFAGILLSLTRGAWLGALVTFPLLLMGLRRRLRWVLLGGLGLSLFLVILFNPVVRGRLVSVINSHNHSNELRRAVWHSNWEIFK